MKEIKLWKITSKDDGRIEVNKVENVAQTGTENQLEEVLTITPELLMKELKLVGRQTNTAGGPLDLLGVDGDGRLVIFELKRGTLTRDAVSQIIDYASYLSELEPEEVADHISERSGNLGIEKIEDFLGWYQEQYGKAFPENERPRMVLVGLGVDEKAKRMVSFLAESEVNISLITFHGFKKGEEILLARQVEVQAKPSLTTAAYTKKSNLEKLKQRVVKLGLQEYYFEMAKFFRDQLAAYEWPNPGGYSYGLPELLDSGSESNRVYIALYIQESQPGRVKISLYKRAIEASEEAFQRFKARVGNKLSMKSDGGAEIWIGSFNEWSEIRPFFQEYCPEIIKGWKRKREIKSHEEFKAAEEDEGQTQEN